jgi:oligoribonuclease NrnB/cAMP/cGMP phosphodiesterase (DHH superfamily)
MSKILCIYHSPCADGFTAAWAVRKALGDDLVEFHAGVYGEAPPDVTGRDVLLVDFSYKRPVLLEMAKTARAILVLDHHKSAAEDLAGFCAPEWTGVNAFDGPFQTPEPILSLFDMDRSGAAIAWDFFHGLEHPRPMLVEYVQDRDLWRFELGGTREINACVFSHPYDFETWDWLANRAEHPASLQEMIAEGGAIERKHHKDIAELLKVTTRTMRIGDVEVSVANLPYTMSSDAAGALAEGAPFGACYWDTPTGRTFSLRSRGDAGADVSEIAARYGGGGHKSAAGFQAPAGWEGDPA